MIRRWLDRLRRRRGTGLIVVIVLAAVMATYVVTNAVALRSLQKRLALIERRHTERWAERQQAKPDASTPGR